MAWRNAKAHQFLPLGPDFLHANRKKSYAGKETANFMRDLKAELEQLREKLRRLEARAPKTNPLAASAANATALPPWEVSEDPAVFDQSLNLPPHDENPMPSLRPRAGIEECLQGEVVETPLGSHFLVETLYPWDGVHGQFALEDLPQLPGNLLAPLCPDHGGSDAQRWAFLDTETTGLAGGAGTFAFLIGLGFFTPAGFCVRQYFLREPSEEPSALYQLAGDLSRYDTLITYNGKAYDLPLLETRYRLARAKVPFNQMPHLDLLHACRRLWKLRFETCKLTFLEERILGHERTGDVPGFLIPSLYANYLRFQEAGSLVPVFTHNALDILSLACLTYVVGSVFADPRQRIPRHGAECVGLGRWLLQAGRPEDALHLFQQAIRTTIPEDLLARTLWDIFEIERKRQRYEQARDALEQLVGFPNPQHRRALEALSILFEHRLKDVPRALHYARRLEALEPDAQTGARIERLVKKLRKSRHGKIFDQL